MSTYTASALSCPLGCKYCTWPASNLEVIYKRGCCHSAVIVQPYDTTCNILSRGGKAPHRKKCHYREEAPIGT
eukprot:530632-Pelagomonas_calceolata.AAC.1